MGEIIGDYKEQSTEQALLRWGGRATSALETLESVVEQTNLFVKNINTEIEGRKRAARTFTSQKHRDSVKRCAEAAAHMKEAAPNALVQAMGRALTLPAEESCGGLLAEDSRILITADMPLFYKLGTPAAQRVATAMASLKPFYSPTAELATGYIKKLDKEEAGGVGLRYEVKPDEPVQDWF